MLYIEAAITENGNVNPKSRPRVSGKSNSTRRLKVLVVAKLFFYRHAKM